MFRNTFSAHDKYSVLDYVNFLSPIQMQLPLKPTIFCDFFISFLESKSNFKHFEKKDDRHTNFLSEITEC